MTSDELPVALRPLSRYPPHRASIFEEPGDEKSWHQSQVFESLMRFYEGRQPTWYASALRPLEGSRRVFDLGAGPGLALQQLRAMGVERTVGVDRWPGFARAASGETPIVLHDLTLPMPFLPSGSFDAVLSHYALDYLSPIGMRQVLAEARRLLEPGGRLLFYLAAVGMGGADETRTVPYGSEAMEALLGEAGFDEVEVELSPNGRNVIARARGVPLAPSLPSAEFDVEGECQLSASYEHAGPASVDVTIEGRAEQGGLRLAVPVPEAGPGRVSVCVRVVHGDTGGAELQTWVWKGTTLVAAESVRTEALPASLRIDCPGRADHIEAWTPRPLGIERPGSAYLPARDVPPPRATEAERGEEGRLVVVADPEGPADAAATLGEGRNRFYVERPIDRRLAPAALDEAWRAGRLHGIVLPARRLAAGGALAMLDWAHRRQVLLYVEASRWETGIAAAVSCAADLDAAVLVVDPALHGGSAGALPAAAVEAIRESRNVHVVAGSGVDVPSGLRGRVVLTGPAAVGAPDAVVTDATDTLRYLTDRAILQRLRHASGRTAAEVGRRKPLTA